MQRRHLLITLTAGLGSVFAYRGLTSDAIKSAMDGAGRDSAAPNEPGEFTKLVKPEKEWRALLDPQAFNVMFEEGTEPPGSSPLDKEKREGTFLCAACFLPLFSSATKYDSGTGWPSFYDVIPGRVATKTDFVMLFPRKEYHCARCSAHQGHVFKDGPKPTGLRYCNNGVALRFIPEPDQLPALRT